MIKIKPHHFMDIIKLYGAGIEHFVPDEAYGHDFYKIANEIIGNMDLQLQLTVDGDDICKPCNRYSGKECMDPLEGIRGFCQKEGYNRELDNRLLTQLQLNTTASYTVRELLTNMRQQNDVIFLVWKEESSELTQKRNGLFQVGCQKLLEKFPAC